MTRPLYAYLAVLAMAAAALSLVHATAGRGIGDAWLVALLAAFGALSERGPVRLAGNLAVSLTLLLTILAAVVSGPLAAMLVGGISLLGDFRRPYLKWAIYTCSSALTGGLAGMAAVAAGGGPPTDLRSAVTATAAAALCAYAADAGFCALTLRLRETGGLPDVIRVLPMLGLSFGLYVPAIAFVAYGVSSLSHWASALFLVPGLTAQRLYVLYRRQKQLSDDLTEMNTRLETMSQTDPLTELPNRALFGDRAQQAILVAGRDSSEVAILVVDLDSFKEVNDTLGHHSGDVLLREVAARLSGALRAGDTIARLGGDEFGVVLPNVAGVAGTAEVVERLERALDASFPVHGVPVNVEASMGAALFPAHGTEVEILVQRADFAMYRAKSASTAYELYGGGRDALGPQRLQLVGELRRALERDELMLHFQPQFDSRGREIKCAEALVRWRHPNQGILGPAEFIPLAQRTSLMKPLTKRVLELAIAQCCLWREADIDIDIAVNVGVRNVLDPHFPDEVSGLLAWFGLEPSHLQLEITESDLMRDPASVSQVLTRLSDTGITLSIDDFGTGYSSLAHLRTLPIDQIKIDRSFVSHMDVDESDRAIVRATVELGRNLGLEVVAEGVETEAARRDLAALECHRLQGYLLSPPLPPDELSVRLERERLVARPVALA